MSSEPFEAPQRPIKASSFQVEKIKEQSLRFRIALVSDYFVPNLGGVEMHMYNVAQCLLDRGHKVVVITGTYSNQRTGIRYLSNGLKVYHIPTKCIYTQAAFPDFFTAIVPDLRLIYIREQI